MSDDIVTRLRNWHDQRDSWQTLTEAADEIERLRASRDAWRQVAQCRLCLPHRLHWCLRHKDTGPEPHQDLPRPK